MTGDSIQESVDTSQYNAAKQGTPGDDDICYVTDTYTHRIAVYGYGDIIIYGIICIQYNAAKQGTPGDDEICQKRPKSYWREKVQPKR